MSEPAVDGASSGSDDSDTTAAGPTDTSSSTGVSSPTAGAPKEAPDDSEASVGDDPGETHPEASDGSEASVCGDPGETHEAGDPVLDVMAALEAERDGHLLDLQRMKAEFANYRRQADRRTVEVGGRARGELAEKLLPVFDACDLALEHGADDVAPIRASLAQILESAGLEVLDPVDEPFDPNRHEAVFHEPADDGDDTGQVVVEVLRRGYAWDGRVLRPAMVRVRG